MGSEEEAVQAAQTAAAIDIGSNALRLVVAQVHPGGETEVLERMSRPLRLGQDAFVSGRISSDIALKASRVGITIVSSRAAPTSRALAYAQRLGLTVIGFARGKRMTVYTWPNRCTA